MDTRTKILTASALATLQPALPLMVVLGRFDLLRLEMVRGLADARQRTGAGSLLVVVRPVAGELAPAARRAEMAAALRVVDYVFIAENGDLSSLPASLEPTAIMNLDEVEAQHTRLLIEHVHARQSA